jgi:hypothetical protein
LTNRPTDDLDIGEIQRTVSQSELIEPLGARTNLTKLLFTLRGLKPPTKAGRTGQPDLAKPAETAYQTTTEFQLVAKKPASPDLMRPS